MKGPGYPEYALDFMSEKLDVCCIIALVDSLDFRTGEMAAPSYQAVARLRDYSWTILSNGPIWRIYCNRSPSESTSFFELNMEGISDAADLRLIYFAAIFSALSFVPKGETTDIDLIYDKSIIINEDLQDDLRRKVFDGQLFLNLARSILIFDKTKRYSDAELEQGKKRALKLLYRMLFILYAEARGLMPMQNENYRVLSLENMRLRPNALEKAPGGQEAWESLETLFHMIHQGRSFCPMPEYDGELFAEDEIDGLKIANKHLVSALKDLMLSAGGGIDYLNLGVRQLGSIYEALLEYSVKQAETDLMILKIVVSTRTALPPGCQVRFGSAGQAQELRFLLGRFISPWAALPGAGSYYTPDEIVRFLVKKGLEPHFQRREKLFREDMQKLPPPPAKLETRSWSRRALRTFWGLEVVDPAMGSGHFLVAAANDITSWAISLLHENPDAPLLVQVEEDRKNILEEQAKRGIRLMQISLLMQSS